MPTVALQTYFPSNMFHVPLSSFTVVFTVWNGEQHVCFWITRFSYLQLQPWETRELAYSSDHGIVQTVKWLQIRCCDKIFFFDTDKPWRRSLKYVKSSDWRLWKTEAEHKYLYPWRPLRCWVKEEGGLREYGLRAPTNQAQILVNT